MKIEEKTIEEIVNYYEKLSPKELFRQLNYLGIKNCYAEIKTYNDLIENKIPFPNKSAILAYGETGISVGNIDGVIDGKTLYIAPSLEIAESALSMFQIGMIMEHAYSYGGLVSKEEWESGESFYSIILKKNQLLVVKTDIYNFLSFHTEAQAKEFLKYNKELVDKFYQI